MRKVAHLYLISDILHNSGYAEIKDAWKFRYELQKFLPSVFLHLRETWVNIQGRITAQAMKDRVTCVLRAWNQWVIYPEVLMSSLEHTFLHGSQIELCLQSDSKQPETSEVEAQAKQDIEEQQEENWDIDGEPLF